MAMFYNSRSFRLLTIALILALILLWITNTFLTLPFGLDPRLLRRPDTDTRLGTGFDKVEALANDAEEKASGVFSWAGVKNKTSSSGDGRKLWFFGNAVLEGGEEIAAKVSNAPIVDGSSAESGKSASATTAGLVQAEDKAETHTSVAVMAPTPSLITLSEDDLLRLHLSTSAVVGAFETETTKEPVVEKAKQNETISPSKLEPPPAKSALAESVHEATSLPIEEAPEEKQKQATPAAASIDLPVPTPTPLILYAFSASDWALPNLRFFLTHGLHAHATFIFILNGGLHLPTPDSPELAEGFRPDPILLTATSLISAYSAQYSNIKIVQRPNTCYDMGAFGEVLLSPGLPNTLDLKPTPQQNTTLYAHHTLFILLNASLRGPFIPIWSQECWSAAYLRPITTHKTDTKSRPIKLVGMTMNCVSSRPRHLQSMILATDATGMAVLLDINHTNPTPALTACPATYDAAVNIEVSLTNLMLAHNYTVWPMMALAHARADYVETCTNQDINYAAGAYEGGSLNVWETMWIKTRWGVDGEMVEKLSGWLDAAVGAGVEGEGNAESSVIKGRSWDLC